MDTASGRTRWRYEFGGSTDFAFSMPAVTGDTVYIGEAPAIDDHPSPKRGAVHAVNTDTGERRWRAETGGAVLDSPSVVGGVVYVGTYKRSGTTSTNLYALDAASGEPRWTSATKDDITAHAIADGTLHVATENGYLHAFEAGDGGATPTATAAEDGTTTVREPSADWQRVYGGPGADAFHDFVQTGDGGYLLVGESEDPDTGHTGAWLVRTDPVGKRRWQRTRGGESFDHRLTTILSAGDGGYFIAGRVMNEDGPHPGAGLFEETNDGAPSSRWETTAPNPGEFLSAAHANDEGFVVAGRTFSTEHPDDVPEGLLGKYRPDGSVAWRRVVDPGADGEGVFRAVVPGSDGGYVAAGMAASGGDRHDGLLMKFAEDGSRGWEERFLPDDAEAVEFYDLIRGPAGGYLAVGDVIMADSNAPDAAAVKIDVAGNVEWTKHYDEPKASGFRSGFFRGGYFVGGYNDNHEGGWLVVLAPDGTEQGQNDWGAVGDGFHALLDTAEGNEAFAGTKGGADGWMVFDSDTDRSLTSGVASGDGSGDGSGDTDGGESSGDASGGGDSDGFGSGDGGTRTGTGTTGADAGDANEERQRGFFTNEGDGPAFLSNVFNLTVLGFLLSVAGIIHQMIKGQ